MYLHDMEWNYDEISGNLKIWLMIPSQSIRMSRYVYIHWGGRDNQTFGVQRMVLYFLELYTGCKITDINKIKQT